MKDWKLWLKATGVVSKNAWASRTMKLPLQQKLEGELCPLFVRN